MHEDSSVQLDVRPLLAQGIEPFPAILRAKEALAPGQALILRAPFEPAPLFGIFQSQGYSVQSRQIQPGEWEIVFSPTIQAEEASGSELDLRLLDASDVLEQTSAALAALERGKTLIILSRICPTPVLDQLDLESVDYDTEETETGHWVTTLWRVTI